MIQGGKTTKAPLTIAAPELTGDYSQAAVEDGLASVSGQLPISLGPGCQCNGSPRSEKEQALHNLQTVLTLAPSDLDRAVRNAIHVSDALFWRAFVDMAYASHFRRYRLPQVVVPAVALRQGSCVEAEPLGATAGTLNPSRLLMRGASATDSPEEVPSV